MLFKISSSVYPLYTWYPVYVKFMKYMKYFYVIGSVLKEF